MYSLRCPQTRTLRSALAGTALRLVTDVRHGNAGITTGFADDADPTGGAVLGTAGALGDILKHRLLRAQCRPGTHGGPTLDLVGITPTTAGQASQEEHGQEQAE